MTTDTIEKTEKKEKIKNPLEQKSKLIEQLKDIENKLAQFDKQRASKVSMLAKKHHLIDLSDDILETEFKAIHEKHKTKNPSLPQLDDGKKNS